MKKITILSAAMLTSGIAGAYAQTNVGDPTPGTGVNPGLTGNYYGQPNTNGNGADLAYTLVNPPVATFTSTVVDYPSGQGTGGGSAPDNETLGAFLGADAGSLNPSSTATSVTSLNKQLIQFTGYIQLTAGANYFAFGADDGGYVEINGSYVIERDGDSGFSYTYGNAMANAAGLYPIVIDYHESGGNTGVAFDLANADLTTATGLVPNSQLFQSISAVPEPSTWMAAGGLLLLAAGDFRRRLKA